MVSVLIVDDDVSIQKGLSRILSIGGYAVVGHAFNGVEAIELFIGLMPKPDIILMDYRMPIMNGVDATRKITRMNPNSRIIFISADDAFRFEAFNAGALDFLTKPIRSKDLFAAIEKQMFQ